MKANRLYFLCVVVFLSYCSFLLHEAVVHQPRDDKIHAVPNNLLNRSVTSRLQVNVEQFCRAPRIAILVSPQKERHLQLYWNVEYVQEGDWIALFRDNPQTGRFPIFTASVFSSTGVIETNFTATPTISSLNDLNFTARCLGYWAAYFVKNRSDAEAVSCLKTNPTWMRDIRPYIENVPIKRVFIPGTHDAGAYATESGYMIGEPYVITQDEDVLRQLIMGIRYLDIRISYHSSTPEKWWINHGLVTIRPFSHVLQHLKTFLTHTREIVILDLHELIGGNHGELARYLKSELSEWLASPNWGCTCGELWKSNKTLIVAYNHPEVVANHSNLLWSPVHHHWANAQTKDELKDYLDQIMKKRPSYSWAAMAELTPRIWEILIFQAEPLRKMAEMTNPQVTTWFRGIWGRYCNIVAVDFFRGTDIVHTAIEWNIRKHLIHLNRICDNY